MFLEFVKFLCYCILIVVISKEILVKTLRSLAENLNLKSQTIGKIAGYTTSMPELLTITISSASGLIGTSIYNILSSNIINLILFMITLIANANLRKINNRAIKTDLVLVILTIFIPILFMLMDIEANMKTIPIFILLFGLFEVINANVHKLYLKKEDKIIEKEIEKETKINTGNKKKTIGYVAVLLLIGIALCFIGNRLGIVLENLCNNFGIAQVYIGIILGLITSVPEFLTFFNSQKHYKKRKNVMPGIVEATNNLLISNMLNLFIIQSIGIALFAWVSGG